MTAGQASCTYSTYIEGNWGTPLSDVVWSFTSRVPAMQMCLSVARYKICSYTWWLCRSTGGLSNANLPLRYRSQTWSETAASDPQRRVSSSMECRFHKLYQVLLGQGSSLYRFLVCCASVPEFLAATACRSRWGGDDRGCVNATPSGANCRVGISCCFWANARQVLWWGVAVRRSGGTSWQLPVMFYTALLI